MQTQPFYSNFGRSLANFVECKWHGNLIQKLRRELYNTRVTLDDLASFKSIPKILSDFKDMFILTKQGQRPIDVEVQSHGELSPPTRVIVC